MTDQLYDEQLTHKFDFKELQTVKFINTGCGQVGQPSTMSFTVSLFLVNSAFIFNLRKENLYWGHQTIQELHTLWELGQYSVNHPYYKICSYGNAHVIQLPNLKPKPTTPLIYFWISALFAIKNFCSSCTVSRQLLQNLSYLFQQGAFILLFHVLRNNQVGVPHKYDRLLY